MGPARHIGKAVVRGINAEMLADGIGHGFCLHLLAGPALCAVFSRLLRFHVVELCVRHFMDQGLYRLHLTHILLNRNAVLAGMKVALGAALDIFKSNRHRAHCHNGIQELPITCDTAGKLRHTDGGQWLALRL